MKIYTLFYSDTELYNHNVFVCPNDATAIKAMKLNLMDSKNERFRNECKDGNVELHVLCEFSEETGCTHAVNKSCCNLKELLEENNE